MNLRKAEVDLAQRMVHVVKPFASKLDFEYDGVRVVKSVSGGITCLLEFSSHDREFYQNLWNAGGGLYYRESRKAYKLARAEIGKEYANFAAHVEGYLGVLVKENWVREGWVRTFDRDEISIGWMMEGMELYDVRYEPDWSAGVWDVTLGIRFR